jgi:hypothetical protein
MKQGQDAQMHSNVHAAEPEISCAAVVPPPSHLHSFAKIYERLAGLDIVRRSCLADGKRLPAYDETWALSQAEDDRLESETWAASLLLRKTQHDPRDAGGNRKDSEGCFC